jgi:hypothetical protein
VSRVSGCWTLRAHMRFKSLPTPVSASRHAEFCRDLFEKAETESEARPAAERLADYAQEIDNLRAALDWAFSPNGDPRGGMALTAAAVPLWMRLSLLEECRHRAKQAFGALGTGGTLDPREEMRLHAALGTSTPEAGEMGAAFTMGCVGKRRCLGSCALLQASRGCYVISAAPPTRWQFCSRSMTGSPKALGPPICRRRSSCSTKSACRQLSGLRSG